MDPVEENLAQYKQKWL